VCWVLHTYSARARSKGSTASRPTAHS